jgi:hypothetical protein
VTSFPQDLIIDIRIVGFDQWLELELYMPYLFSLHDRSSTEALTCICLMTLSLSVPNKENETGLMCGTPDKMGSVPGAAFEAPAPPTGSSLPRTPQQEPACRYVLYPHTGHLSDPLSYASIFRQSGRIRSRRYHALPPFPSFSVAYAIRTPARRIPSSSLSRWITSSRTCPGRRPRATCRPLRPSPPQAPS